MTERRLRLPPFSALRAFHAAATHERFRDAADSLGVTESAISHQLKRLEEHVQVALIDRSGSKARLTEAGRRYLEKIEPALFQIQAATDELRPSDGRGTVRLTLPPSLAANWLIPRLGTFERQYPSVSLQLLTSTRMLDLNRDQVDLAIRHGKGSWRGVEATFLLEEAALPVCADGYLAPATESTSATALMNARLIVSSFFPDEWEEWARARNISPPSMADSIMLEAQEQALELAAKGHGVAMGRRPVVDEWLASGRLVAPFGAADPTGAAYYLCKPSGQQPSVPVRQAERWLVAMAEAWRTETPNKLA